MGKLSDIYLRNDYVVLDAEFDTPAQSGKLVLAVTYTPNGSEGATSECISATSQNGLYRVFTPTQVGWYSLWDSVRSGSFLVAHNAKAELGVLDALGFPTSELVIWDTMVGEWVLMGGLEVKGKMSLEDTAVRYGAGIKHKWTARMFKDHKASDIPEYALREHCIDDVAITNAIFLKQREEIIRRG